MSTGYVSTYFFLLLVAVFFAAGCGVRSVHPLSDPADATIDEQLLGVWRSRLPDDESGTEMFLHIGRRDNHVAASDKGCVRCLTVFHNEGGQVSPGRSASLFTTKIGGRRIANLRWQTASGEASYIFAKYEIVEDELQLFPMRTKPTMDAVRKGELEGDIARVFFVRSVILTDSEALFEFVARACDEELFGKTTNLLFDRISP